MVRRVPWWLAVFALALGARLGFLLLVDPPLIAAAHVYFNKALWIAQRPDPVSFVLGSDAWHNWNRLWTIAPLYPLFAAAVFELCGPHLLPLQVAQCVLGSVTALMVGLLARATSPEHGAWAGVLYAVYWPAVMEPASTMTETLHTALLLAAFAVLARGPGAHADDEVRELRNAAVGGLLLGLSALTRAVSTACIPLAALWRRRSSGARPGRAAAALLLAGAGIILPWTLRNALVLGDPVVVETVSFHNLWTDNAAVDPHEYEEQERVIAAAPTPAARRGQALAFAGRGIVDHPDHLLRKARSNLWYLLRPEGLHALLISEYPHPGWVHVAGVVFDDAILLLAVPPFLVFLVAGRPSPARGLIALWTAYYLFMLVVVFHVEIRYRSAFVPFLIAGAPGGLAVLAAAPERSRRRVWAALLLGLLLVARSLAPYAAPARGAVVSARALGRARAALAAGDLAAGEAAAREAGERGASSARPWVAWGRALAAAGRTSEAIDAYRRAEQRRPGQVAPLVALPALLRAAGRLEEAEQALRDADAFSLTEDPTLALEVAWRDLPAPRTDEILLGRNDYGAVRGFLGPHGRYRWTRHRAWLRLRPTEPADAYDVILSMGSRRAALAASPEVTVRAAGAPSARFTLTRDFRPYTLRARPRPGQPIEVEIDAPTWNDLGQPAEQGVCVERMTVAPVR